MSIGIYCGRDIEEHQSYHWLVDAIKESLLELDASLEFQVWPNIEKPNEIECALAWLAAPGVFQQLPNLKAIFSLGAGVDHILNDTTVPTTVSVTRIQDRHMARDMMHYAVNAVLNITCRSEHWRRNQVRAVWAKKPPFNYADKVVGVMGLGFLGSFIAKKLAELEFKVLGWSRSKKTIKGVLAYEGTGQYEAFLNQVDILICVLPLTEATKGILNESLFAKLRDGAYLVNIARGALLIEQDLLMMLASEKLAGAYLDVFQAEPLATGHPFWRHPKVTVTPHIAAVTNPQTVAKQVYANFQRLLRAEPMQNCVDRVRGY